MDHSNPANTSQALPNFVELMSSIRDNWNSSDAEGYFRPTALLSGDKPGAKIDRFPPSPRYRDDILSASSSRSTDMTRGNLESPYCSMDGLQKQSVSAPFYSCNNMNEPKTSSTLPKVPRISSSISKSSLSRPKRQCHWEIVMSPSPPSPMYGKIPSPNGPNECAENICEVDGKASGDSCEERPYGCSECDARFRKRCNLRTHISNVHDKIKPYYCPVCFRRFARKSNCGKHVSYASKFLSLRI